MKAYVFGAVVPAAAPDIRAVIDEARRRRRQVRDYPLAKIVAVLDRAGRLWNDPAYRLRRRALQEMPALTGFHRTMVEEELRFLVDLLRRESLEKRIACELRDGAHLDGWAHSQALGGHLRAEPLGTVVHIGAGNVFVGPLDSLIQGMVTKNVNILKMSSDDPLFPILFCRSLKEADDEGVVSGAVAALSWKGGDGAVEDVVKRHADAVVVYGGRDAVESWRRGLGLHTRLVEYGPKYSIVLVAKESLGECLDETADRIALDASRWEQGACASPHVVYVERGSRKGAHARALMAALGEAFARVEETLPQKSLAVDEAVEITRVRELATVSKALGGGDLRKAPGGAGAWSVVVEEDPRFTISCLNRTLFVKEVPRLEEVPRHLEGLGKYLQTAAIIAPAARRSELASELSFLGADRFTEAGRMTARVHGVPHDGVYSLERLVRWSSLTGKGACEETETLDALRELIAYARAHAPFYRGKFRGLALGSLDDWLRFPTTTGGEMRENTPPRNSRALTGAHRDGFVFTSGGTTGEPKFVFRTHDEQEHNASFLAKGLLAGGLKEGGTAANLLFAGNMWGSFVTFSRALAMAGCRVLPIGGNIAAEEILRYLTLFPVDAALAIPSVLLSLAHLAEERGLSIRIPVIFSGGEHIFRENLAYLKRVFHARRLSSIGYATNDVGAVGWQCAHLTGGLHHIHRALQHVEILDPATGLPSPQGEAGKVVVTNLHRRLQPMIRYDVGDMGRWLPGGCPCGDPHPLFELLGRSDDILIIGGGNIYPEVIREALAAVEGLSSFFTLTARLNARKDELVVRAEMLPGAKRPDLLAKTLEKAIYRNSKELATMREKGLINPVVVEVAPPGALPRNARTGKLRLIEDTRV